MPQQAEESRVRLLEPSPDRDLILSDVDVEPVSKPMHSRIIQFNVEHGSSIVFDGVFDRGNSNNEYQRDRAESRVDTTKDREDLGWLLQYIVSHRSW